MDDSLLVHDGENCQNYPFNLPRLAEILNIMVNLNYEIVSVQHQIFYFLKPLIKVINFHPFTTSFTTSNWYNKYLKKKYLITLALSFWFRWNKC